MTVLTNVARQGRRNAEMRSTYTKGRCRMRKVRLVKTTERSVQMVASRHVQICQLIIVLMLITATARGEVIRVDKDSPTDYQNIQAGIDAANDGDVVLVVAGEYDITAPVTFRGKAITLRSEAGRDETTIRMGTPADTERASVVAFENNETSASILQGFTITGGRGCWYPEPRPGYYGMVGGGILCMTASPTIVDCTITQNRPGNGGGVAVGFGGSPILANCIIMENTTVGSGGGMNCWDNSYVTMTNCIIKGNSATGMTYGVNGAGGGILCGGGSELTMTNCSVSENSTGVAGGGVMCYENGTLTMSHCVITDNTSQGMDGGIGSHGGSVSLTHCIVARNTAQQYAGGIKAEANGSLSIRNCTIIENSAGEYAGGVHLPGGSSATITNSIIRNNTAPRGPEINIGDASRLGVTCSNVAGGATGVYVGGGTLDWGAGNIDVDPSFVSMGYWVTSGTNRGESNAYWVEADYHLKSQAGRWDPNTQSWIQDEITSPCIDAGDPMTPIDLEFFPNGGFVNMGAYGGTAEASKSYFGEPVCGTIIAGDINGDCQVDRKDLEIMALHWTDSEPVQRQ